MSDSNFCTSRAQIPATIRICFSIHFVCHHFIWYELRSGHWHNRSSSALCWFNYWYSRWGIVCCRWYDIQYLMDYLSRYVQNPNPLWFPITRDRTLFDLIVSSHVCHGVLSFLEVFVLCVIFGTWAVCQSPWTYISNCVMLRFAWVRRSL